MNRLVAVASINVGDDISSYRNRWIANYDWLEIIKHSYSIPPVSMTGVHYKEVSSVRYFYVYFLSSTMCGSNENTLLYVLVI
jgi:hypothetical protein